MYGVIDIGSNTIRLVIYSVTRDLGNGNTSGTGNTKIKRIMNKKYTASLASYITDGLMSEEGILCAGETLKELKSITDGLNLEKVYVFATAPFRNIENTEQVVEDVERNSGFPIRVLSGEEEAKFGFAGLENELRHSQQNLSEESGLLFDLGGGSTELVTFNGSAIRSSCSLTIGSLNLYKTYVSGILPTEAEIRKIRKQAKSQLKHAPVQPDNFSGLTCCEGGSARAVLKLLREEFPDKVKKSGYKAGRLDDLLEFYLSNPKDFTDKALQIAPDRIHTIIPGLVVMQSICETFHCRRMLTVRSGVREGYLLSKLEETPYE